MDNKDEVLLTSLLFVSLYLCNTNRVPNAINKMCEDFLFLLQHKTLGNMDEKCVKSFENFHSHVIECGIRPILEHCEKALAIAEKSGDRREEARCHGYLGCIFESLGEYVKAQEHYVQALAIAEEIGDRKIEARCYASLGSIFESLGEYVKAKEHYVQALAIAEEIGNRIIEAPCYVNLGDIFLGLGEYVKAG